MNIECKNQEPFPRSGGYGLEESLWNGEYPDINININIKTKDIAPKLIVPAILATLTAIALSDPVKAQEVVQEFSHETFKVLSKGEAIAIKTMLAGFTAYDTFYEAREKNREFSVAAIKALATYFLVWNTIEFGENLINLGQCKELFDTKECLQYKDGYIDNLLFMFSTGLISTILASSPTSSQEL